MKLSANKTNNLEIHSGCIRNQYPAPLQQAEEKRRHQRPQNSLTILPIQRIIYFEIQGCPNKNQKRKHLQGSG